MTSARRAHEEITRNLGRLGVACTCLWMGFLVNFCVTIIVVLHTARSLFQRHKGLQLSAIAAKTATRLIRLDLLMGSFATFSAASASHGSAIVRVTRSPANQVCPYSIGTPCRSEFMPTDRRIGAPSFIRRCSAWVAVACLAVRRVELRV